ncbi:hypothetical protein [Paenibacillus arenosi]|uniref:Site-specific integrase n=1 Tax=Paenibacillus arenosi TaxID=2774142 RepID=A0ABR9AS28_9BACL|nr:hypothetical protein [Paenibacillus arenosi]MBD8496905.1 hypothetical protein [Paenibacillus arenosi]
MKEELLRIIYKFGLNLSKSEYNQYIPKLRDYFVKYLIDTMSNSTIENVFKHEFTRNNIIQSTIYYVVNNENVKSKSAIDDFLIALNRFFEESIYIKYPNHNLISLKPFTSLNKEIESALSSNGIKLEERQSSPSINDEQYKFILNYIHNDKDNSFKTRQVRIIIKLFLLYGFSFDRIINLKKSDYSLEHRILEIVYKDMPRRSLQLEVPYSLHKEFEIYLQKLSQTDFESERFFLNTRGNPITHEFTIDYLKEIRNMYFSNNELEKELRNPFTPTGLAKYAIIRMILDSVNQSVISDLTDFKTDVLSNCQDIVNEIKELNRNRYVNHMIRGLQAYDEL